MLLVNGQLRSVAYWLFAHRIEHLGYRTRGDFHNRAADIVVIDKPLDRHTRRSNIGNRTVSADMNAISHDGKQRLIGLTGTIDTIGRTDCTPDVLSLLDDMLLD